MTTSSLNNGSSAPQIINSPTGMPSPSAAGGNGDGPTDDFGYDTPAETAVPAPVIPAPAPAAKPDDKPVEAPVTGYVKPTTPPAPAAPVEPAKPTEPEVKPEEQTPEQKAAKELNDTISALGDEFDKEKIRKFATENNLTKPQVEAYAKMTKDAMVANKAAQEQTTLKTREGWINDLVADKEFGGDNFDQNVHTVETFVTNHMPEVKKMLTEKKGMLPPYFMKDLLKVAKAMNPVNSFNQGSAPVVDEGDNWLEEMYK